MGKFPTFISNFSVILAIIWEQVTKSQWFISRFGTFSDGKFYIFILSVKIIRIIKAILFSFYLILYDIYYISITNLLHLIIKKVLPRRVLASIQTTEAFHENR